MMIGSDSEGIDLQELDAVSRDLYYDTRAADVGPVLGPQADLDELRVGLTVVPGSMVTLPSGDQRDAKDLVGLAGQSSGLNDWVAAVLGAIGDPTASQQNNLGCALLWIDDAPWKQSHKLFTAAKKSDDKAAKKAANHNLVVLGAARLSAKKGAE
ncbi:MAG: hypothetical protein ABJC24_00175 [Chloroflexota bacterium]